LVGEKLAEEEITTTSGFVTHRLGGFPKEGDVVRLEGFTLRVETMDGMRVSRLRLESRKAT
jgi:CBS domain containing-hemolysin-like protein